VSDDAGGVPPGNDQLYVVASVEVLVNDTVCGAQPGLPVVVNEAVGAGIRDTVLVMVVLPQALVVVSLTV
jgi:hypothetical protein